MLKIFKPTDRIELKIDEVTFSLRPLTYEERMEIVGHDVMKSGEIHEDMSHKMYTVLKKCVKGIKGIQYADGSEYELEFDEGELAGSCVSDLMGSEMAPKILLSAAAYLNGVSNGKLIHPATGEIINGVEFKYSKKKVSRKTTTAK